MFIFHFFPGKSTLCSWKTGILFKIQWYCVSPSHTLMLHSHPTHMKHLVREFCQDTFLRKRLKLTIKSGIDCFTPISIKLGHSVRTAIWTHHTDITFLGAVCFDLLDNIATDVTQSSSGAWSDMKVSHQTFMARLNQRVESPHSILITLYCKKSRLQSFKKNLYSFRLLCFNLPSTWF